jgi:hypothetical protein
LETFVTRSGSSITVESPWFQVNYAGALNGADYSASGTKPLTGGGGAACGDSPFFEQLPGTSNLTGHFSADDQQMTATEVNSYRLTTGETVTYTWNWVATRR